MQLQVFALEKLEAWNGFNTASGKYCCNYNKRVDKFGVVKDGFNTVNGKYCCNDAYVDLNNIVRIKEGFNTVNGKYCCNNCC